MRVFTTKLCTFQKEQEEIMQARPSTQKGLNLKEIKQMEYLSKVYIWFLMACDLYLWGSEWIINNSEIKKTRWKMELCLRKLIVNRLSMRCCAKHLSRLWTLDRQRWTSASMVSYSIPYSLSASYNIWNFWFITIP